MQKTKNNSRKNGRKSTPDIHAILGTKRGPGRPKKTRPASEIADDLEAQAKKLQNAADILRGKT